MKTYFALVSLEIKLMLRSKSFWIIACLSIVCADNIAFRAVHPYISIYP